MPPAFVVALPRSIHGPPAVDGPAEARDLVRLDGELIVVRQLLAHGNVAFRVDDNLLGALVVDDLGVAVRLRRETSK